MTRKSLGRTLLLGAVLTLVWACVSPRYQYLGQTQTIDMVDDPDGHSRHSEPFWHPDIVKFTGGLVFIWTGLFGAVLLLSPTPQWLKELLNPEPAKSEEKDLF